MKRGRYSEMGQSDDHKWGDERCMMDIQVHRGSLLCHSADRIAQSGQNRLGMACRRGGRRRHMPRTENKLLAG